MVGLCEQEENHFIYKISKGGKEVVVLSKLQWSSRKKE